jgi:hypothetical protein
MIRQESDCLDRGMPNRMGDKPCVSDLKKPLCPDFYRFDEL